MTPPSLFIAALVAAFVSMPALAAAPQHTAAVDGSHFLVDGKPFQIISGEMHYPRIPRAYWKDRLAKLKAMGLNTVTTYVFWNAHEATPGHYDFTGQNDVAEFIREAQKAGLYVILRPGPYVCAEWELGGYPAWLLKDRSVVLRSRDPKLAAATDAWFTQLGKQLNPLLLQNGGPILATQVENEYGSFGDDHEYVESIHRMLVEHGLAAPILYTADGPAEVPNGSLKELPAVINFGTGEARSSFAEFAKIRPEGPRMSGEYWAGWFDHWGTPHETRAAQTEADELGWMLQQGYSVSLYMADGGTSFGWMNGANSNGKNYEPDTTSYDYDAPISENGDLTPKYFAFQQVIAKATGANIPAPLAEGPKRRIFPVDRAIESASLWANLPEPVSSPTPLTMEDLDQNYGYVLYSTELAANAGGELKLDGLHDFAQIYVNRKLVGTLDRRLNQSSMTLPPSAGPRTLEILVENTGRVNYTAVIRTERKGLTGAATLAGAALGPWNIYSLPLTGKTDPATFRYSASSCSGPCFYRSKLNVDTAADTYLDLSGNFKGFVWINQTPLGRFWQIGPQYALWTPGAWLHGGANDVIVFDLAGRNQPHLRTSAEWVAKPGVPLAAATK